MMPSQMTHRWALPSSQVDMPALLNYRHTASLLLHAVWQACRMFTIKHST